MMNEAVKHHSENQQKEALTYPIYRVTEESSQKDFLKVIREGDAETVMAKLEAGISPNFYLFNKVPEPGRAFTAHHARNKNADLNEWIHRSKKQDTPLSVAVSGGHWQIALMLLEAGANPFAVRADGRVPIFGRFAQGVFARANLKESQEDLALAKILIERLIASGCDIDAVNGDFDTPIFWLCSKDADINYLKLMHQAGARLIESVGELKEPTALKLAFHWRSSIKEEGEDEDESNTPNETEQNSDEEVIDVGFERWTERMSWLLDAEPQCDTWVNARGDHFLNYAIGHLKMEEKTQWVMEHVSPCTFKTVNEKGYQWIDVLWAALVASYHLSNQEASKCPVLQKIRERQLLWWVCQGNPLMRRHPSGGFWHEELSKSEQGAEAFARLEGFCLKQVISNEWEGEEVDAKSTEPLKTVSAKRL